MVEKHRLFMFPGYNVGYVAELPHISSPSGLPIHIETVSTSPRVFKVWNFFSEEEADQLVSTALGISDEKHMLKRSSTGAVGYNIDSHRTSENAFDTTSDVIIAYILAYILIFPHSFQFNTVTVTVQYIRNCIIVLYNIWQFCSTDRLRYNIWQCCSTDRQRWSWSDGPSSCSGFGPMQRHTQTDCRYIYHTTMILVVFYMASLCLINNVVVCGLQVLRYNVSTAYSSHLGKYYAIRYYTTPLIWVSTILYYTILDYSSHLGKYYTIRC